VDRTIKCGYHPPFLSSFFLLDAIVHPIKEQDMFEPGEKLVCIDVSTPYGPHPDLYLNGFYTHIRSYSSECCKIPVCEVEEVGRQTKVTCSTCWKTTPLEVRHRFKASRFTRLDDLVEEMDEALEEALSQ
jgi:hypothetical protein